MLAVVVGSIPVGGCEKEDDSTSKRTDKSETAGSPDPEAPSDGGTTGPSPAATMTRTVLNLPADFGYIQAYAINDQEIVVVANLEGQYETEKILVTRWNLDGSTQGEPLRIDLQAKLMAELGIASSDSVGVLIDGVKDHEIIGTFRDGDAYYAYRYRAASNSVPESLVTVDIGKNHLSSVSFADDGYVVGLGLGAGVFYLDETFQIPATWNEGSPLVFAPPKDPTFKVGSILFDDAVRFQQANGPSIDLDVRRASATATTNEVVTVDQGGKVTKTVALPELNAQLSDERHFYWMGSVRDQEQNLYAFGTMYQGGDDRDMAVAKVNSAGAILKDFGVDGFVIPRDENRYGYPSWLGRLGDSMILVGYTYGDKTNYKAKAYLIPAAGKAVEELPLQAPEFTSCYQLVPGSPRISNNSVAFVMNCNNWPDQPDQIGLFLVKYGPVPSATMP